MKSDKNENRVEIIKEAMKNNAWGFEKRSSLCLAYPKSYRDIIEVKRNLIIVLGVYKSFLS